MFTELHPQRTEQAAPAGWAEDGRLSYGLFACVAAQQLIICTARSAQCGRQCNHSDAIDKVTAMHTRHCGARIVTAGTLLRRYESVSVKQGAYHSQGQTKAQQLNL